MHKYRGFPVKALIEQDMLGCRAHPLIPTDHMGDLHQVIVNHVSEVVGGESVALQEDLIVDISPRAGEATFHSVVIDTFARGGDLQS